MKDLFQKEVDKLKRRDKDGNMTFDSSNIQFHEVDF